MKVTDEQKKLMLKWLCGRYGLPTTLIKIGQIIQELEDHDYSIVPITTSKGMEELHARPSWLQPTSEAGTNAKGVRLWIND